MAGSRELPAQAERPVAGARVVAEAAATGRSPPARAGGHRDGQGGGAGRRADRELLPDVADGAAALGQRHRRWGGRPALRGLPPVRRPRGSGTRRGGTGGPGCRSRGRSNPKLGRCPAPPVVLQNRRGTPLSLPGGRARRCSWRSGRRCGSARLARGSPICLPADGRAAWNGQRSWPWRGRSGSLWRQQLSSRGGPHRGQHSAW